MATTSDLHSTFKIVPMAKTTNCPLNTANSATVWSSLTDIHGRPISRTNSTGQGTFTTTTSYQGNQITTVDGNGNTTKTTLDSLGRPTTISNGITTKTYTYANGGRTVTETIGSQATTRNYNEAGEITSLQKNGINLKTWNYNYEGRTVTTTTLGTKAVTTTVTKDLNNFTSTINTNGITTTYQNNSFGFPTIITGRGKTITNTYDSNMNLLSTSNGMVTTAYNYDPLNRKITETVGSRTKTFSYDDLNRLTGVQTSGGIGNLSISYPNPNTKIWNYAGQPTTFTYDGLGRETGITRPNQTTRTIAYDGVGNISNMTDFDGKVWSYTYDANNNKLSEEVGTSKKEYKYNESGLLTEATTFTQAQSQTQTISYDFAGRISKKTFENGKQISYTYYPNGQIERITDNLGGSTYYKYNEKGQLTEIKDGNNKTLEKYEYNDQGQLTKKLSYLPTEAQPQTQTYQYDTAGRVLSQRAQSGDAEISDSFAYDDRGNIVEKTEVRGTKTFHITCTYYKDDLLQSYEVKDETNTIIEKVTYNHDNAGNRTKETTETLNANNQLETTVVENTFNNMNQLVKSKLYTNNNLTSTVTNSYDVGGRLFSSQNTEHGTQNTAITSYSYNNFGNLQTVNRGLETANYNYSYDNKRITSTINGSVYDYTYHGNELFETYSVGTGRVSKYVHSNYGTVGMYSANNNYSSIITDYQNSVIGVINSSPIAHNSSLAQAYSYRPFGKTRYASNSSTSSGQVQLGWLSRQYDNESGNHYLINRYYNSNTGRFNKTDWYKYVSTSNPYSMNLYQYGYGNPMTGTDANGLYLIAFDGTNNYKERALKDPFDNESPTNVAKLEMIYMKNRRYYRGVGTNWYSFVFGGGFGLGGKSRIRKAYNELKDYILDQQNFFLKDKNNNEGLLDLDIDVIGFSRGAAQARQFANKLYDEGIKIKKLDKDFEKLLKEKGFKVVKNHKNYIIIPTIRYMGIFDTVASFGIGGNDINIGYELDIPSNVKNVYHAIATDESRRFFPLSMAKRRNDDTWDFNFETNIVHKKFIGAHSDVGGGYKFDYLSTIPLKWMWTMGIELGVPFGNLEADDLDKIKLVEEMSQSLVFTSKSGCIYSCSDPSRGFIHDSRWWNDRLEEWIRGHKKTRSMYN